MQAAPPLREGDALAGRYRLVRRTGGTAPEKAPAPAGSTTTWRGRDLLLGRPVELLAVAGGAQDVVDAARRAALVDDPRVMRVLDVGSSRAPDVAAADPDVSEGRPADVPGSPDVAPDVAPDVVADPDARWSFVVTEAVPGETLAAMVTRRGPLPAPLVRTLVGEAAQALERARALGLHHRRLTPAHLRRVRDGGVGVTGVEVHAAAAEGEHAADGDAPADPGPAVDPAVAARADAVALVALAYAGLTGRWPGPLGGAVDEQDTDVPDAPALPLAPRSPVPHGAGDQPVPPADLVADVPADLDLLCAVTLGPHEDGPRTPGELAEQLAPWDSPYVDGRPGGGARPARRPAVPAARRPERDPVPAHADTATGAAGATAALTTAPAVPSPATRPDGPPRPGAADAGTTGAVVASGAAVPAAGGRRGPLAAGPAREGGARRAEAGRSAGGDAPGGGGSGHGGDGGGTAAAVEGERPGRGQSVVVVAVVALAVVAALVWAVGVLRGIGGDDEPTAATPVTTEAPAPTAAPTTPAPTTPAPTEPSAVPEVVGATDLDPEGDGEEGSETVDLALDGDTSTAWRTSTYGSTSFGNLKDGVGYALDLGGDTPVQAVTFTTEGDGGTVEVRTADGPDVDGSEVVATADLGGTVEVDLPEGTTTQHLVLWFTELPEVDGEPRLELAEVEVR